MPMTRRQTLALGLGGAVVTLLPLPAAASLPQAVLDYTDGAVPEAGDITLTAPEIAENGNAVPVEVSAPDAVEIVLFAPDNPDARVCTFQFGPAAGEARAATRIRMAGSQTIHAVARLPDGRLVHAGAQVMVTVGGCVV